MNPNRFDSFMKRFDRGAIERFIMRGVGKLTPVVNFKYTNNIKFTQYSSALTFGLFCGAQALALTVNDKIPKDTKKFLIPREITEGVLKIGIFLFITHLFKVGGYKLVDKGLFVPKWLKNYDAKLTADKAKTIIKDIKENKYIVDIKNNILKPAAGHVQNEDNINAKSALNTFRESIGMITNLMGMTVGLSLVVPPIRNKVASMFKMHSSTQKNDITKTPVNNTVNVNPLGKKVYNPVDKTRANFGYGSTSLFTYPTNIMKI